RHLVGVAAGLGTVGLATADRDRRALVAPAGVAGALLLVGLGVRTGDLAPGLDLVGTRARLGPLPLHHLPEEVLVHVLGEDGLVELDRAHRLARDIFHVDLHRTVLARCGSRRRPRQTGRAS